MHSPPLEAARMSDLCRHVSVHILPFHQVLVHDPNGSGTSHSLLCLTLPFSESLEHEQFVTQSILTETAVKPSEGRDPPCVHDSFPRVCLSAVPTPGTQRMAAQQVRCDAVLKLLLRPC